MVRAAEIIRGGGLVVIPTETVYGLACDALNPDAVRKVFTAKGRPESNPLIVHLADIAQLAMVADGIPPSVYELAERFWPGPLTMVLRKRENVPDETTGGLTTVAVRIPAHALALALIRACGRPVAAPSANPFTELSPTRIEHLSPSILKAADLVLDGGPCTVGVESTVIDMTREPAVILRPGAVTREDLRDAGLEVAFTTIDGPILRSPGQYSKHYAPRTPLSIVCRVPDSDGGLTMVTPRNKWQIQMPSDPSAYQAALYDALYRLDRMGLNQIKVERPPNLPDWEAVHDRLRKARGKG